MDQQQQHNNNNAEDNEEHVQLAPLHRKPLAAKNKIVFNPLANPASPTDKMMSPCSKQLLCSKSKKVSSGIRPKLLQESFRRAMAASELSKKKATPANEQE